MKEPINNFRMERRRVDDLVELSQREGAKLSAEGKRP
jgi:hypothetical protein